MKKKYLLAFIPLLSLIGCSSSAAIKDANLYFEEGVPTIKIKNSEHTTYLMLSPFGSIENYEGISVKGDVASLYLENTVILKAEPGTSLPDKTQVVSSVPGATFRGWACYDDENGHSWPNYLYDKVPEQEGLQLKAIFDGTISSEGGGSSDPVVDVTWTVKDMPTWVTDDGCVIFAWAWQNNVPGNWYALSYTTETSATFEAPSNLAGMLLVRCAAGTTTPDWEIANADPDGPGKVYNQTDDVTVTSGVREYSFPNALWKTYVK